jgi:hypothetical protein
MLTTNLDKAIIHLGLLYQCEALSYTLSPALTPLRDVLIFAYQLRNLDAESLAVVSAEVVLDDLCCSLLSAKLVSVYAQAVSEEAVVLTQALRDVFQHVLASCHFIKKCHEVDGAESSHGVSFAELIKTKTGGLISALQQAEVKRSTTSAGAELTVEGSIETIPLDDEPSPSKLLAVFAAIFEDIFRRDIDPQLNHHLEANANQTAKDALSRAVRVFMQEIQALQRGGYYAEDEQGAIARLDFPRMLKVILAKCRTSSEGREILELTQSYPLRGWNGVTVTASLWPSTNRVLLNYAARLDKLIDVRRLVQSLEDEFEGLFDFYSPQCDNIAVASTSSCG